MTEKYIATGAQAQVWHYNEHCPTSHTTELVPVEEAEIPQSATPCSYCADGIDAQKIRSMVKENATQ